MKKMFRNIKDWIWDALFLDFYLDKRWTLRFKLMNLISGDTLRIMVMAWANLKDIEPDEHRRLVINDNVYSGIDHESVYRLVTYKVIHAKRELNDLVEYYSK